MPAATAVSAKNGNRGGRRVAAVVAILVLAFTACGGEPARPTTGEGGSAFPVTLADDEGVSVTIRKPPRRIVTFGPSHTEIVFALGLADRLVGVCCQFDNYPPAAMVLPEVAGAAQQPNVEKVVSLDPDLMVNAFPGSDTWAGPLRDAGIPVFTTLASDYADALHDIRMIGRLTGAARAAGKLTATMASEAEEIEANVRSRPRVSCFLDLGALYTVGPNDFIFDLLERAGCDPVTAAAKTSFPQWSKEQLVRDDPTVYLFTSDSGTTVAGIRSDPALKGIAAARNERVFPVDADLISRPGPRLPMGLLSLARLLHPDAV